MRSFSTFLLLLKSLVVIVWLQHAHAGLQTAQVDFDPTKQYYASLELHSSEELMAFFKQAETLLDQAKDTSNFQPVVVILHGPEIKYFERNVYAENKELVDLAAKLDAFGLVDIQMCRIRIGIDGKDPANFPKFIEVVPSGAASENQLRQQGYIQF